jgi:hypothetical protein
MPAAIREPEDRKTGAGVARQRRYGGLCEEVLLCSMAELDWQAGGETMMQQPDGTFGLVTFDYTGESGTRHFGIKLREHERGVVERAARHVGYCAVTVRQVGFQRACSGFKLVDDALQPGFGPRIRGDESSCREYRDRYRAMATKLAYEGHMKWAAAMP